MTSMSTQAVSLNTHEFRIEKIHDNDSSFLASVRFINGYPDRMDNKYLRSEISKSIRKNVTLNSKIPKCINIKDYCDKIENEKLHNDEIEKQALSMLCRLLICIVFVRKTMGKITQIDIKKYGENIESFTQCSYLFYDEERDHYDAMYTINRENPSEKITVFQRNDKHVAELLQIFIQKINNSKRVEFECVYLNEK